MPLNPRRAFNALLEGPLRPNDDGMWALYEGDEELTYWDEGQPIELLLDGTWHKGTIAWLDEAYGVALEHGAEQAIAPGTLARRRVGGSV